MQLDNQRSPTYNVLRACSGMAREPGREHIASEGEERGGIILMEKYYDDERQSMRTQEPRPVGVAAAQARLLCRSSLVYRLGYAAVVAPGVPVAGAMGRRGMRRRNRGPGSFRHGLLIGRYQ